MGPTGSGKSRLAYVLAGRDGYVVTGGRIVFEGQDLVAMSPEERARAGVFLAFQYPVEIPGVANASLLRAAVNAVRKHRGAAELDAMEFLKLAREKLKLLKVDESFLSPPVNVAFSAGDKNPNAVFHIPILE